MGLYTVSQSSLAPIAGVHNGTGHQHDPGRAVAVAGSVPGSALLQFSGMDLSITTMLFVLNANVVPNWFGVAVPDGLTDFTRPNIFFHPTPGQAGYNDADYPTKGGQWPKLFYYMERLGYQIAGSGRGQVVVMPFLTDAATSTGILPANWQDIITDILQAASTQLQPGQPVPASIAQVVVSSFSDGILYSHSFRATGAGLQPLLGEIWDLDGSISTVSQYSADLRHGQSVPVVQYDQNAALGATSYHVPWPRWADYYDTSAIPKSVLAVHPLIRDFMYLHAGTVSTVGSTIQPGAPQAPTPQTPAPQSPVPNRRYPNRRYRLHRRLRCCQVRRHPPCRPRRRQRHPSRRRPCRHRHRRPSRRRHPRQHPLRRSLPRRRPCHRALRRLGLCRNRLRRPLSFRRRSRPPRRMSCKRR